MIPIQHVRPADSKVDAGETIPEPDKRISARMLGTPSAKNSQVVMTSDGEEGLKDKGGKKRLRRLAVVMVGVLIITIVMMAL